MTPSTVLVAFDLDDTIYKERDFVMSGYRAVAKEVAAENPAFNYDEMVELMVNAPVNAFDSLEEYILNRSIQQSIICKIGIPEMVKIYRTHFPDIAAGEATEVLTDLVSKGYRPAIITDGRKITQTNKIRALGLDKIIPSENISISEVIGAEKFMPQPFERMMKLNPDIGQFVYAGDNPMKDFVWPNRLGWTTIQIIDDGHNIHSQAIVLPSDDYAPQYQIYTLSDLPNLLSEIY
ncbi:MAG: HAD family hydrolase [Muribaculaceae bacterium]|nr:HAD family hydrolase [Muribaculaceae bacterium]